MGRAIAPLAMTVMFAVALVLGVPACTRIPVEPRPQLVSDEVFDRYIEQGIAYHALRTRQAGRRSFISFHALVPGKWSVHEAHDWIERIERDLRTAIPNCHITSHLEPIDDPCSMDDQALDRVR